GEPITSPSHVDRARLEGPTADRRECAAADHPPIERQRREHDPEQGEAQGGGLSVFGRIRQRVLLIAVVTTKKRPGRPRTSAAANEPSISANTNTIAPRSPGRTKGSVILKSVLSFPAPVTRELSSSDGSIDFMTAEIITKATVPSKRAITHAMPNGV